MKRLTDKIAIVTGAARGLGAAIATRLAAEDAQVVLVDVLQDVIETADVIARAGGKATGLVLDLSDLPAIESLARQVEARHRRIDILVNNAGISPKQNGGKYFVEETPLQDWQAVLAVNLTSIFLLCKACLPAMRQGGGGRIINMSSAAGRTRPTATSAHYSASKAGLIGFSRCLANEVGPFGITVNCVAPGMIETAMFGAFAEATRLAGLEKIPLKRFGSPGDIAAAVAFLASDDAGYITGTTLDVNGGLFMT
jgi:3-oxoacyl-[acyl-carrier protein] reductase